MFIIQENRKPTFGEKLNAGLGRGLEYGQKIYDDYRAGESLKKEDEAAKKLGIDLSGIKDPAMRKAIVAEKLRGASKLENQQALMKEIDKMYGSDEEGSMPEDATITKTPNTKGFTQDISPKKIFTNESKETRPIEGAPEPKGKLTSNGGRLFSSKQINKMSVLNPAAATQMAHSNDTILAQQKHDQDLSLRDKHHDENIKNQQDLSKKRIEAEESRRRFQETAPIRQEIANKAMAAEEGIRNKQKLLELIKHGDIDDPTYATLAQSLPLSLGKRLLSNDTVEYKAGLIEEFGDLRNLFQGQTRVKEIELLEEKIADLYLTDDQKEAILKSRINALRADIIKADVASELEKENLSVLEFQKELNKRLQPKMESLFNQILDEQKGIIAAAESRKTVPLNIKDPDDKKIAESILKEAGGDRAKARQLAKKKGYTF